MPFSQVFSMSYMLKRKILSTTMLIAPAVIMLTGARPALADCTVTSGGGTVTNPANGATITCTVAGGDQTTTIGNGTDGVGATVNIEDGATVDVGGGYGLNLNDVTLTLGDGATFRTTGNNNWATRNYSPTNDINVDITLGNNAIFETQGTTSVYGVTAFTYSPGINVDTTVTLSGNNAQVRTVGTNTADAIYNFTNTGDSDLVVTLSGDDTLVSTQGAGSDAITSIVQGNSTTTVNLSGENSSLQTQGATARGVYINSTSAGGHANNTIVTLSGAGSNIQTQGLNAEGISSTGNGSHNVTLNLSGAGSYINSAQNSAVYIDDNGDGITTNITLSGDNTQLYSSGTTQDTIDINATGALDATITLSGNNAQIQDNAAGLSYGVNINAAGGGTTNITLGSNTSIVSQNNRAVRVGGSADVTIDNSGLISGVSASIVTGTGNDNITLRTGSNLVGNVGTSTGTDALTLVGNGSEDVVFTGVENLNVNADSNGWVLSGASTFSDINVNSGLFTNTTPILTTTNLTIDSGAQMNVGGTLSVTGSTTIDSGGTFNVGGTVLNTGNVNNNGRIEGNSTLLTAAGNLNNNGTIAPGGSGIAILNISNAGGGFIHNSGATLDIELDSAGNTDTLNVLLGTTTLNSGSIVNFSQLDTGTITNGQTYNIITTTTGVTLNPGVITNDNLAFMGFTLSAPGNNLVATAALEASNLLGETQNQVGVESAINNAITAGLGGNLDTGIGALTTQQASNFLASQSGAITIASVDAAAGAVGKVNNIVRTRITPTSTNSKNSGLYGLSAGDANNIEPAAGHPRKDVWIQAVGGFGDTDSDSRARGSDYRTLGAAAGIETTSVDSATKIGTFFGFSNTNSKIKGLNDKGNVKTYQLGLYGYKRLKDKLHVNGSLSGAFLDFRSERPTNLGTASGKFKGLGIFGFAEAIYDIKGRYGFTYSPFIGLETSLIHRQSYTENGADVLNLALDSETTTKLASILGLQIGHTYHAERYITDYALRLGWSHEFLDNTSQNQVHFVSSPSIVYQSEGPDQNRNAFIIGLNSNISDINDKTSLYANYDGRISSDTKGHMFTAGVKTKW